MCGIVGIVNLDPRDAVDETLLKRMRDVLRHRGPDGEGLWVDGRVGLGHRRLAIVDVATGQQPMTNEDGSCWITFNGEIYNHAALRPGLEALGHRYRTRSDTECILHLYEEEQERCVEALRGMFAFALWDQRRRQLLLARDRLGIKPLYYAVTDRALLFASEIKSILVAREDRPLLNTAILPEFLATRYVAGEETFFRGVRKLLPGHTLSWSDGDGLQRRRYWRLAVPEDDSPDGLEARARELEARLEAAVSSHLMSDVPVGLFLSGGVDSSGLAALMAPALSRPVRTFAVGFAEREANELAYARLAADAIEAEHREVVVTPSEFFEALPRMVWHEDEPPAFSSSVPLYFVSRLAGEHVKVVLTGEGSDELFLGYDRYRVTAWNLALGAAWSAASPGRVRAAGRRLTMTLPWRLRRFMSRSFLALEPGPRALFCENFSVFPPRLLGELLDGPAQRDPYAAALHAYADAPGDALRRMSHADLQTYLVELLMKQDQMSMAASVESRVPFLDHELVEHALAVPSCFKVRGLRTKAVLRRALAGRVPPAILARRKMGFPVPFGRWVRDAFWPVIEEFVLGPRARARGLLRPEAVRRIADEHRAGVGRHGDRLWLLVNLEIWHRIFLDGEDLTDIGRTTGAACASSG
jgi:asparagine synthase (glutamine-hydrolysing)